MADHSNFLQVPEETASGVQKETGDGMQDEPESERLLDDVIERIQPVEVKEDVSSGSVMVPKSSKKVQLPGEELGGGVGGAFTIGDLSAEPEEEWEMVPPDGGWGWFVLVGAMVVNILVPGTIKSFGVLFVEFMEVFDAGQTAAAWIPALCYFLYSSLGPLSSILSVKWSYRTVTLIGGCFAAFGMMLSFWAFSVGYLYISYGVMVGTGAGLSFPPTVYIVTSYFVRLRGLANGICISGSAFGSIILPPILRYLLETYGYRGAVLIMGGITLNVWAAALLFQPVEQHLVRRKVERESPEDMFEDDIPCETYDPSETVPAGIRPNSTTVSMENGVPLSEMQINGIPSATNEEKNSLENQFVRSASAVQVQNTYKDERRRKISMPIGSKNLNTSRNVLSNSNSASKGHIKSTPSLQLEAVPEGKYHLGSNEAFVRKTGVTKQPKRSPSTSSFQYMSTPFHGSTLSAFQQPSEFASQLTLKSIKSSFSPVTRLCRGKKRRKNKIKTPKEPNKFFDITLLKDPTYLVILISNCTNAISYTNFIILLPSYAITMGFDKSLGAYLISIVSLLDLVGRIGGSALSDTELLPKTWYFVGGLLISGFSLAILPFVSTYGMISACCAVFGLASGVYVGVTALIMAEMLGTERLTSTYGISLFFNGILQLIGPPICGVWFERTKSYLNLFMTLGFILIFGAGLWGFMPYINARKRLKLKQELANRKCGEMQCLRPKNGKKTEV